MAVLLHHIHTFSFSYSASTSTVPAMSTHTHNDIMIISTTLVTIFPHHAASFHTCILETQAIVGNLQCYQIKRHGVKN